MPQNQPTRSVTEVRQGTNPDRRNAPRHRGSPCGIADPNSLVFSANFADGAHTVRIEPVGTATGKATAVAIDRLVVR